MFCLCLQDSPYWLLNAKEIPEVKKLINNAVLLCAWWSTRLLDLALPIWEMCKIKPKSSNQHHQKISNSAAVFPLEGHLCFSWHVYKRCSPPWKVRADGHTVQGPVVSSIVNWLSTFAVLKPDSCVVFCSSLRPYPTAEWAANLTVPVYYSVHWTLIFPLHCTVQGEWWNVAQAGVVGKLCNLKFKPTAR